MLDQAVYVPAAGGHGAFIAGVRGGYVHKFNATTGVRESSTRYVVPPFGECSICYDSVTDKIYCAFWNQPSPGFAPEPKLPRGIYEIDPVTMALGTIFDICTLSGVSDFAGAYDGPHQIIANAGLIYGWLATDSNAPSQYFFRLNPGSSTLALGAGGYWSFYAWQGLAVNGTEIWSVAPDNTSFVVYPIATLISNLLPIGGVAVFDLCVNPSTGRGYFTTRGATVKRVESDYTVLSDITIPGTSPYVLRIRYNSNDSLIYAPDIRNNSIAVIDPVSDTVTATKTGFESPIDCVFTPTKKWAVQASSVGLREIT